MRFPCTPIPDSGFPNSEIRMAYGNPGIPHHEVAGPRAAVVKESFTTSPRAGGIGHRMSNTNSGVGHGMTDGVPGCLVLNRKGPTLGTDTRKEGDRSKGDRLAN